jgi:hypothetical protein
MPHPLETKYGLTAKELLDALNERFRARVTLEGAVAEVHAEKKIKELVKKKVISCYEKYDEDNYPDFAIWLNGISKPLKVECKNVRDNDEAFRKNGKIVAYKVETQKTRASKGNPASRYYDKKQFQILAVCLGKKTNNWKDFLFIKTKNLISHPTFSKKLAVIQRVPLPDSTNTFPWFKDLADLIKNKPK